MKKSRYSKPKGKEVPSRRKLAMEAERLQVAVEQKAHELRCTREDLERTSDRRRVWESRAESMREENERLRKQVEGLMPPERFLQVSRVDGFGKVDEMQRYQTVGSGLV